MTAGHDLPERDPALERAWRAHSRETPPPELDRAILAAAHRAAGSAPHDATKTPAEATRPQRWWMPLAAAATIGAVAIGILQVTPDEDLAVAPMESAAPAVAPRADQRVAAAVAPETSNAADAVKERVGGRFNTGADDATQERSRASAIGNGKNSAPAPQPSSPPVARLPSVAPAPSVARAPFPVAKRAPESADTAEAKQKLTMAPAPQPFPAAPGPTKSDAAGMAERKLEMGRASGSVAGAAKPNTPTEAARDHAAVGDSRAFARKDAAGEDKQQLAAATAAPAAENDATPPLTTAIAGAATSSAVRPVQSAPARAREFDQARAEPRQQPMAAAPATAPPPASLAKTAIAQDELRVKARDPAAWIARIRQLRDEGNAAEAIRELRELRRAVPDADQRLPGDMREWAASVKP